MSVSTTARACRTSALVQGMQRATAAAATSANDASGLAAACWLWAGPPSRLHALAAMPSAAGSAAGTASAFAPSSACCPFAPSPTPTLPAWAATTSADATSPGSPAFAAAAAAGCSACSRAADAVGSAAASARCSISRASPSRPVSLYTAAQPRRAVTQPGSCASAAAKAARACRAAGGGLAGAAWMGQLGTQRSQSRTLAR